MKFGSGCLLREGSLHQLRSVEAGEAYLIIFTGRKEAMLLFARLRCVVQTTATIIIIQYKM